jgi:hypothetical protein
VRGASALQAALERAPGAQAQVLVVWEPVLVTDVAPPSTAVLAEVGDRRVRQYWDRGLRLSEALRRTARTHGDRLPGGGDLADTRVVWDVVAIFPPGVVWEDEFPLPVDWGFPVIDAIDLVDRHLAR